MAETYPSQSLSDQSTASLDLSQPKEDQYGLVVDQTKPMGHQYGQVVDQPDTVQMPITHQALQYAQTRDTQKISQADIRLITHKAKLRKAELDNLFEELGISAADIDNSRRNADTTDFKLQSSAIFRAWVVKQGKYATRNKVIEALRECDLTVVAELLDKTFSESVKDISPESPAVFDLHECQEELRAYYLDEMGKVNLLPWIPEESKEMESIFVDLELARKEESKASQKIKSNEELVTLKTNKGQRVNRVLVTGDAGSGKSTTAANLAYEWAKNDTQSPLCKFLLVFLIRMKDIEDSNSSLVDLIFQHILTEESSVSKEDLHMFIKENAQFILFVIDGVDEDSSGALKNKSSEITKLLHNKKMRKSCVILTTRPRNISDLGMYVSHYTQVKLEGFSVKNIHKYIGKYFRDDKKTVDRLFRTLDAESHILALASIPVLLLMICLLWEDQHITSKTKTQLYQKTIRYMWRRYKARMSEDQALDEDSDNEEFDEELTDLLHKLGEVALNNTNLDWNKNIFTVNEFRRDVCDLGCQMGILKTEQSRVGLEKKTSVAFLHATFQEFCAAFYLAYLLDTNQKALEDFDGKLFSLLSEDELICKSYVLEFCCGIQPLVTTTFLKLHTKCRSQVASEIYKFLFVDISIHMKHIFEGQLSYEQCSNMIPKFTSHYNGLKVTSDLIPSVIYMLELYKSSATQTGFLSTVESLTVNTGCTPWLPTLLEHTHNLYHCTVYIGDSDIVRDLDKMYKALSVHPNIKHLALVFLGIHEPLVRRFDATNLLIFLTEKRIKLISFALTGFHFDENAMGKYFSIARTTISSFTLRGTLDARGQFAAINNVIDTLSCLKHLSYLELSQFQIGSAVKHLRPLMSQLKELSLIKCCIHEKHLKELFYFLSRAQKLKVMDLSENVLSVASVQALVESLQKTPFLEELNLEETGLNDESACIIAKFVKRKPTINALRLDNNPDIGHAGKDALRGLPLRREVQLGQFSVTFENIDTL